LKLHNRKTPFQKIVTRIQEKHIIPDSLIELLPNHWRRVGTIGILELKPQLYQWKREIGEAYLEYLPELTTIALKVGATTTTIRTPNFEYLAGDRSPITLHKELKCQFWIDAFNLTFSTGNHFERQRMINITKKNEKIIDMFACVGNLSLPIAVHDHSVQIQGIEINPYAFNFLTKNIKTNKVEKNYKAILGDNRDSTPEDWADRVIMGYFGIDKHQFAVALKSLQQNRGGIIHAHGLSGSKEQKNHTKTLNNIIQQEFQHFRIELVQHKKIKTVAPGVEHFVEDFLISPK